MGRKPTYDRSKIIEEIIERISNGETLRSICREEGKPGWRVVYDWLRDDKELAARFAHARELGHDAISEECLEIADKATDDLIFLTAEDSSGEGAKPAIKHSSINRAKLQIETRLKLLAKWNPKKWGDSTTIKGDKDSPLTVEIIKLT